ncbi:MAG: proline racemase family protein [Gammaproteobacteria bacterium]|nr:proline racemase family protein [Gammaproteobacteria bacterium]
MKNNFGNWQPPADWLHISSLEMHTGGEPLRIITGGFPTLKGDTILEKRQYCLENFDDLRQALIFEPRGHADMYAALITEPERSDSHFGVLFLHNEGYSTMCGHAIIALSKAAVEAKVIAAVEGINELRIDSPAGLITSYIEVVNGAATNIYFNNVASFVSLKQQIAKVEGIGNVTFDLAYGGAFYAYVDAEKIGLDLSISNHDQIIASGQKIKAAVQSQFAIEYPGQPDLSFLYGVIFISHQQTLNADAHSRNVCIFAEGELDRSPTGTGVSGRAAIHFANNELSLNQAITIESILGTSFEVKVVATSEVAQYPAVIPQINGMAYVTGSNEFYIDPHDPLKQGFILR